MEKQIAEAINTLLDYEDMAREIGTQPKGDRVLCVQNDLRVGGEDGLAVVKVYYYLAYNGHNEHYQDTPPEWVLDDFDFTLYGVTATWQTEDGEERSIPGINIDGQALENEIYNFLK